MVALENKMDTRRIAWREQRGIRHLVFPRLGEAGLSLHAFTSRPYDLGFGRRKREEVLKDRRKVCQVLGINFLLLTAGEQVHGARVVKAGEEERGRGTLNSEGAIRQTDGFISNVPGVPLTILTADCVPIFILDPVRKAIGLVHAGWKGTLCRMTERVVTMMEEEYGSRPEELIVALGPSIGPCCYQVGEEVVTAFRERFPDWPSFISSKLAGERWTLDLWEATRLQLMRVRVKDDNIINSQMCTSCHNDVFFSRRRDGSPTGRMMSLMML
ncbi:peptidoglycan editing factor PgeF [candidate division NPL-UPA2 bacterium]|nr:peptidoglycan editing factor PgeF [candidate division NPL-UPA2 bacterium]